MIAKQKPFSYKGASNRVIFRLRIEYPMNDVIDRPRAAPAAALPFVIPANRWSEKEAAAKSPPELLLYRSNLLGSDLTVTNFGGGNTSAKLEERDPLTHASTKVL